MKYAILKNGTDPLRDRIASEVTAELAKHQYEQAPASDQLSFILNLTNFETPKAVHRKAQGEFVVSMATLTGEVEDLRYLCYNTLIKTLSNFVLCVKQNGALKPEIYCITPEAGFYHFTYSPGKIWKAMQPIVEAHFMIDNRISTDLPPAYFKTKITEQLRHYGGVLDSLGLLPAPFDLHQLLTQENLDHVYYLFKVRGLSYGNLSAREDIPEIGPNTFWMTARGVDKAHLQGPGQDILLVTGYDAERREIFATMPPDGNPRIRVSVDAIEHALIYQNFPEVKAIVHVHAWMEGVPSTKQNAPCGTIELARDVVQVLKSNDHPERAVVGLKNHGLTITGTSLEEIFSRIEGKILNEVPMMP